MHDGIAEDLVGKRDPDFQVQSYHNTHALN